MLCVYVCCVLLQGTLCKAVCGAYSVTAMQFDVCLVLAMPCTCCVLLQGTLREALDRRRLPRVGSSTFLQPAVVLSLAHDIAAALLHLHSEGIV